MAVQMEIECMWCGQRVLAQETTLRAASHPHPGDPDRECPGTTTPGKDGTARRLSEN